MAGIRTIVLQQDVVANRIHKRSQSLGVEDFAIAQRSIKSYKRFLAYIFDRFARLQSRTQLQLNQRAEVRAKMLLGRKVSGPQALKVRSVEGVKLQVLSPGNNGEVAKCST